MIIELLDFIYFYKMILGKPYKKYFLLDESITYFNFGAFGAAAKPVFED